MLQPANKNQSMFNQPTRRIASIAPFHVMELLGRARALEAEGRDIIHMEVGEPDFPTPEPIVAAAQRHLTDGRVFYTPSLGLPELREAIAAFYATRYGVTVPSSRIVITAGASGALLLALSCLVETGSEWLLTDPGYPCNRNFVTITGGTPICMPVAARNKFQPTLDDVRNHWNSKTGGALFASPANPTGTMIDDATLGSIAEFVRSRNGALIVDEIYHGLTYGRDASTALQFGDDLFIVQSFSKYFNMTGWRLGWLVVPEEHLRNVEKLAQNLFIAPPTTAQHAALAAFQPETLAILEGRRLEFQRRRDFLIPALESLGFKLETQPEGAFYLYADCSAITPDSQAFARDLLEEAGVAITPGIDFGTQAPATHVRIAYASDIERLDAATKRIRTFLSR